MARRAIITGSSGLIGHYLVKAASRWAPHWNIYALNRNDVDLTDRVKVERTWQSIMPELVIHCAALSRTKDCEQDPEQAARINAEVTAHLAQLSQDAAFIFLSSAEVFDGTRSWYDELAQANPINVYGKTKLEAESLVLQNPRHTVLRIVLTAGTSRNGTSGFVDEMCRAARDGNDVRLYTDEFRCPLPAGVIARVIWELADEGRPGLYHLGGRERLSRWDIGQALLPWYPELCGRLVGDTSLHHQGARRPADLSLQCDKIQRLLSFRIPGFQQWLTERPSRGSDLWDYLDERP